jgi:putative DNA primase/helicase
VSGGNGHATVDVREIVAQLERANATGRELRNVSFVPDDKGKPTFVPSRLAEVLVSEAPVAKGGQQLYVYAGGVYQPGESRLAHRIAEILADSWRRGREAETLAFLRASSPEIWERPPLDRINVRNGVLDLATGVLEPHTPEFRSPVQLAVAYDPDARCPRIDRFLEEVVGAETAAVFFEIAGYLCTPDNSQQLAVMFEGPGGNGKSKALSLLTAFLGPSNVSTVPLHKLEEDRFAAADLYGKLANVFADLDARALRSSGEFKAITGGDAVRAERKHRDSFSFVPYARLLFSANQPPPTSDSSQAFFDRWIVVPFHRRIRGSTGEDRDILAKLTTQHELSGLLNRALEALAALRQRGRFTTTEATLAAAAAFRQETDSVAGFLAECVELDPEGRWPRPAVYQAYSDWTRRGNRQPTARERFNRRLRELAGERGHELDERKIRGVVHWAGLRLTDEAPT